ncbi:MAG TPA: DUF6174 domain-containing protein [Gemmatimonadales bacterium]|nr:DUF6174 domain-containing protein [Gemmatimonadales bacterium]
MTPQPGTVRRTAARAWALLVLVTLPGCQSTTFTSTRWEAELAELNRRYQLWKSTAPAHYEYTFNRICPACTEDLNKEVIVEVTDTTIVTVTYTDGSGTVPASGFGGYFTVEGLFGQVEAAINLLADSLRVQYDPTLHYPTLIIGDPNILLEGDELALFATGLISK